ncbi:MAG: aminotransferase class I/II-fold pyridoxal phosphate-dependent enzyme [Deltaproteobacteria bacterium]|nr:aminotransferase class I/II-fold pyridoxal phosphate-dependent enzyme [Deltaproteobacteria bacterium]
MASQLAGLVRGGRIAPESLLPPVRDLASLLDVSPGTVAAAYKTLRAQGLVSTDRRRGTRVLPRVPTREYGEDRAPAGSLDLQVANPDPALLPKLGRIFSRIDPESESYGGTHLHDELIELMRGRFLEDGIPAGHFVVTSGAIAAIHRALRVCLSPGDKVAVEDPGFNDHHAAARAHGLLTVPVPLDDEGLLPEHLEAALRGGARAVILAPRFQSPTGAALSKRRALELRAVFSRHPDTLVLLDDYASALSPPGSYHHVLDRGHTRFLVVRSFNKVIAPDLRVGVVAADAETADLMLREQWLTDGWVSAYLQRVAAAATSDRGTQLLIARARDTYALRRTTLLTALRERGITAHGATGLNVWVPVSDEAAVVRGLLEHGYCVRAGARYRLQSPPAVRVTTARLDAGDAHKIADVLAALLRTGGRGP